MLRKKVLPVLQKARSKKLLEIGKAKVIEKPFRRHLAITYVLQMTEFLKALNWLLIYPCPAKPRSYLAIHWKSFIGNLRKVGLWRASSGLPD